MATQLNTGTTADKPSRTDEAKEKAQQAASTAQQKIGEQVKTSIDSGKDRAAEALGGFAQALTSSSQELRDRNMTVPGQYVEQAGEQLRRASDYLRDTNVDQLARSAEDFARRQPAVFLGGIFAVGFLAARLLKASQNRQYMQQPQDRSAALVPQSPRMGDRETSVSGYREPSAGMSSDWDNSSDRGLSTDLGRSGI